MTTLPAPLVAILDGNPTQLAETRRVLERYEIAQIVSTGRAAHEIPRLLAANPDIVLLAPGADLDELPAILSVLYEGSPRCAVVVIAERDRPLDPLALMQAGVRAVVYRPLEPEHLRRVVQDVFGAEQRRLERIEAGLLSHATRGRGGEVITVFSPKGGVGGTVIACNLAIALARASQQQVALADFSLQFGDVGIMLNLRSPHGVHELMYKAEDLDKTLLDSIMVPHQSGVRVLLPPPTLAAAEEVNTDGLLAVIEALRRYHDFVVVDTWHMIEDATMAIMEASTTVLIVTTPEVPALRDTRRALDYFRAQPGLSDKLRVVVNRHGSKSAVDLKAITEALDTAPFATIPNDGRLVTNAANEGVPLLSHNGPITDAILRLAATLATPRMARAPRVAPAPTAQPAAQPAAPAAAPAAHNRWKLFVR